MHITQAYKITYYKDIAMYVILYSKISTSDVLLFKKRILLTKNIEETSYRHFSYNYIYIYYYIKKYPI